MHLNLVAVFFFFFWFLRSYSAIWRIWFVFHFEAFTKEHRFLFFLRLKEKTISYWPLSLDKATIYLLLFYNSSLWCYTIWPWSKLQFLLLLFDINFFLFFIAAIFFSFQWKWMKTEERQKSFIVFQRDWTKGTIFNADFLFSVNLQWSVWRLLRKCLHNSKQSIKLREWDAKWKYLITIVRFAVTCSERVLCNFERVLCIGILDAFLGIPLGFTSDFALKIKENLGLSSDFWFQPKTNGALYRPQPTIFWLRSIRFGAY